MAGQMDDKERRCGVFSVAIRWVCVWVLGCSGISIVWNAMAG